MRVVADQGAQWRNRLGVTLQAHQALRPVLEVDEVEPHGDGSVRKRLPQLVLLAANQSARSTRKANVPAVGAFHGRSV